MTTGEMLVTAGSDAALFNVKRNAERHPGGNDRTGRQQLGPIVHRQVQSLSPDHGEVRALYVALMRSRGAWSEAPRVREDA
ncbi:hypothetical protein D3C73_1145910 [compost metagenome]